ncbi:MAG: type II secretion system F family protein [Acidimicrobiales bacterium]|nr:type II secretion system F family protein [Acidimicrobiales bacterium]MYH74255.1 type II secretion system F family protein [Acidimicrobiales bacterium]MYI26463.1 type II secretion system F family protein [Acidimicrobiales bacterium]MYK72199.1 type II secretion system F family protein [Acidimicrobiales bacterium]
MIGLVAFGTVFALGLAVIFASARRPRTPERARQRPERDAPAPGTPISARNRTGGTQMLVQAAASAAGAAVGFVATGLLGLALLLGGLGALLPPFVAAPRRRRTQTREALAWQLWTRQLAELTRSGAGLTDALTSSTEHAPSQLQPVVKRVASVAELRGIGPALDELAAAGVVWEPDVAVGLRIAADSGGPLTAPLLELCNRIGDVVSLHRARTEAVVQLWTQTIALLGLAGGVVLLMYRNNPAYFEPYRTPTGQLVLSLIAMVLLGSTVFLVYHSVVRVQPSVLAPPPRRRRGKDPL